MQNSSEKKPTITSSMQIKPSPITTEDFSINGWAFIFQKSGILPSTDLDQLVDKLALQGIPDIVYGRNFARLVNVSKNFVYEISPQDALSFVNYQKRKEKFKTDFTKTEELDLISCIPDEMKIKQAEFWKHKQAPEDAEIKVLEKISDWTYTSPYKGTPRPLNVPSKDIDDIKVGGDQAESKEKQSIYIEKTDENIPLNNLTQANPIKWFNEFVLYEDELGDCGLSQCFFRFRTMGDCFFGLLRYYLRIDEVAVRIYDTRIYHEFKKDYILREFSVRENSYNELKQKGFKFDAEFNTDHRQSDLVYAKLDVKSTFKDKVFFQYD